MLLIPTLITPPTSIEGTVSTLVLYWHYTHSSVIDVSGNGAKEGVAIEEVNNGGISDESVPVDGGGEESETSGIDKQQETDNRCCMNQTIEDTM